jgi:hypothetical protein
LLAVALVLFDPATAGFTETPASAGACVARVAGEVFSGAPSAAFEAAAELSCTAFIVARVFWTTLGLCAAASPEASTHTKIVILGFILFLLFLHRASRCAGRP